MDMCVCANVYERSRACVRVSARVCALESNRLTLRLSSVFLRSSASVRVLSRTETLMFKVHKPRSGLILMYARAGGS